jgi:hypothetical protein
MSWLRSLLLQRQSATRKNHFLIVHRPFLPPLRPSLSLTFAAAIRPSFTSEATSKSTMQASGDKVKSEDEWKAILSPDQVFISVGDPIVVWDTESPPCSSSGSSVRREQRGLVRGSTIPTMRRVCTHVRRAKLHCIRARPSSRADVDGLHSMTVRNNSLVFERAAFGLYYLPMGPFLVSLSMRR